MSAGLDLADQRSEYASLVRWWARMRESKPVHYDAELGNWHVFRYDDVVRIIGDHETFSSDLRSAVRQPEQFAIIARGAFNGFDPPEHTTLRSLVRTALTPRMIAGLEPRITAIAHELLDSLAGRRQVELVADLAYPLPLIVIAELMNIPLADRHRFRAWADALFFQGRGDEPVVVATEEMLRSVEPLIGEMNAYFLDHIRYRRQHPAGDLISMLAAAEVAGARLTDEEVLGVCGFLLVAGHITTTLVLGNAVHLLATRPDLAAALRREPGLIPATVEEVLRFRGQLPATPRRTTREVTIAGQVVPAGEILLLWIASANRDERQFTHADRFDPRREPNRHLGFGRGIHFCVGAPLARLEQHIALRAVLDRWDAFSLDGPVQPEDVRKAIGFRTLPLEVSSAR
ncbi:cytochrome P450 [Saccharopolyspora shandongensis]|uniref:cytochrome P450 n=1 Tax=Saccharopolyspora shandongensis TaxID=418495 RepID=UPI0033F3F568